MRLVSAIMLVLCLGLAACGDDGIVTIFDDDREDISGALNRASGDGGAGVLTIDNVDHATSAVICRLEPTVDIGTVDEDGWRLFITQLASEWRVEMVDPELVQWISTNNNVVRNGSTFTGADTFSSTASNDELDVAYEVTCS